DGQVGSIDTLALQRRAHALAERVIADAADEAHAMAETAQPNRQVRLGPADIQRQNTGFVQRHRLARVEHRHALAKRDNFTHCYPPAITVLLNWRNCTR